MKVFITGDRALDPLSSIIAADALMTAIAHEHPTLRGLDILTGDQSGVEAAVRYLLPGVRTVASERLPDGKIDFDARHGEAIKDADQCWVFHTDPLASNIYRSAVKFWGDSALRIFPSV